MKYFPPSCARDKYGFSSDETSVISYNRAFLSPAYVGRCKKHVPDLIRFLFYLYFGYVWPPARSLLARLGGLCSWDSFHFPVDLIFVQLPDLSTCDFVLYPVAVTAGRFSVLDFGWLYPKSHRGIPSIGHVLFICWFSSEHIYSSLISPFIL